MAWWLYGAPMMMQDTPLLGIYDRFPITLVSGSGPYVRDDTGREYLDFASGVAVNALGHAPAVATQALLQQANTLWHVSNLFHTLPATQLAQRLCDATFADKVFFCNSGAEAVECGIKAVRRYHYNKGDVARTNIITFAGAFHGRTLGTIAAGGNAKYLEGFGDPAAGFIQVPFGDHNALKAAFNNTIAAVLIEPIQGEGGVRVVPPMCLQALRELCQQHGALLMFDEVQTGMGRTGALFAYQHSTITPDVLATAKGIGGGFPLGACLFTQEVASAMTFGTHGNTFGGNLLACAVGNAVLDVVNTPELLQNVRERSAQLQAGLNALQQQFAHIIAQVRGTGLLLGVQLQQAFTPKQLANALIAQGMLSVAAGENVLRLLPPLNITAPQIDEALNKLHAALLKVETI